MDFAKIEREAESKSKSYVTDYSRPSTKTEPGGFSEDDKVITTYPFKKEQIDFDIKRREFTALVIKKVVSSVPTLKMVLMRKSICSF